MRSFWNWMRGVSPEPPRIDTGVARSISNILFPRMVAEEAQDGTKFLVDTSADSNLESALQDIQDGHNDISTQAAIGDVLERLGRIRKLLGAYSEFPIGDYKYVVVDTVRRDPDVRVNDIDNV